MILGSCRCYEKDEKMRDRRSLSTSDGGRRTWGADQSGKRILRLLCVSANPEGFVRRRQTTTD